MSDAMSLFHVDSQPSVIKGNAVFVDILGSGHEKSAFLSFQVRAYRKCLCSLCSQTKPLTPGWQEVNDSSFSVRFAWRNNQKPPMRRWRSIVREGSEFQLPAQHSCNFPSFLQDANNTRWLPWPSVALVIPAVMLRKWHLHKRSNICYVISSISFSQNYFKL